MIGKIAGTMLMTAAVLLAGAASAQSEKEQPKLTPEQAAEMEAYQKANTLGEPHKAMAASVGKYTIKSKMWNEPGGPATEETGTVTRTLDLDGRVLVEDFRSTWMGAPFIGRGTSGFDNVSGKYWRTWTDNMSTGIMVSEGKCDAKQTCTYTGSYNDPIKKAPVKARMVTRWTSPTTEILEMYGPAKDGKEMKMMEMTYTKM